MIPNRFAWRAVAVASVAAITLSACGGGDDDSDDGTLGPGDDPFEGTMTLGTIFPDSGSLAFLSPPMYAGAELAMEDINAAGGVWGEDLEMIHQDEGDADETERVVDAVDSLIQEGVHGVVGAASSTASLNIIDRLYEQQIPQVSASNTGPDFTDHENGDYYFRTAPSDILQGSVLASEVLNDGHDTLGVLGMQNDYGEGLADRIDEVYTDLGGEVVVKEYFDPNAAEYDAEVNALRDADPDAIALVSYEQAATFFPALSEAGMGPEDTQWYLVDGNLSDWSEEFSPDELSLEGVKGTRAVSEEESQEFYDRMFDTDHMDAGDATTYGAQTYDAVTILALGAIAANTDDTTAIRDQVAEVTRDGEDCHSFEECNELLEDGESIRYIGEIGEIDWTDTGDLGQATIGLFEYADDNEEPTEAYATETAEFEE